MSASTAADYVRVLNLDEDVLEDIEEEIGKSRAAWAKVKAPDVETATEAQWPKFYDSLLRELGSSYTEDVAEELSSLEKGSLGAFTDFYISWLFKEDDEEYPDEGGDDDQDAKAGGGGVGGGGWSQVQWAVKPVATAVDGVTWQCATCRIVNDWTARKCVGCDSAAPHSDSLPPQPAAKAGTFSFGAPTSAAASTTGAISSSGFSFPAASGPGAISSSGFTFPGPGPSDGTSAPSVFSFGSAPVSSVPAVAAAVQGGGFSFTPSAASSAEKPAEKKRD